jgi:hypothetical protein
MWKFYPEGAHWKVERPFNEVDGKPLHAFWVSSEHEPIPDRRRGAINGEIHND